MDKNIKKIDKKSLEKSLEEIWQDDKFDANGSYTGSFEDGNYPVQDADDLWFWLKTIQKPPFWWLFCLSWHLLLC